jgi:hypothetical protein
MRLLPVARLSNFARVKTKWRFRCTASDLLCPVPSYFLIQRTGYCITQRGNSRFPTIFRLRPLRSGPLNVCSCRRGGLLSIHTTKRPQQIVAFDQRSEALCQYRICITSHAFPRSGGPFILLAHATLTDWHQSVDACPFRRRSWNECQTIQLL